ncbi:hypothetical protein ACTXT7_013833 [Hymenolepis weldensis]
MCSRIDEATKELRDSIVSNTCTDVYDPDVGQNPDDVTTEGTIIIDIIPARKRTSPAVVAEANSGYSGNRIFLNDRNIDTFYLIDFGAANFVIHRYRTFPDYTFTLLAANESPTKTYGQKSVTLDLRLGIDFLCHFGKCSFPNYIAKDEFKHMSDLGINHRSSNNWSSAFHIVPKKSGD